jgi:hypothetical protein
MLQHLSQKHSWSFHSARSVHMRMVSCGATAPGMVLVARNLCKLLHDAAARWPALALVPPPGSQAYAGPADEAW